MDKEREIIERFTEHLNKKEKIKNLAVIGREKEIKGVICVLSRLLKNNPLLIGHPGVGKTAVVEGLVQQIEKGEVPDYLKEKNVYQLDMMSLRAGTKFQGELEARLKVILNYMARPENNAILFIDEIHMIVGGGGGQGFDLANLLKPMLSRGEIQCIGATTQEEYRQHIEKDGALMRRFSNIHIPEPTAEETKKILLGIKGYLEIYYELKINYEAIVASVNFSQRYLTNTYLPDKAIDLLDETCGRVRSEMWYEPEEIEKTRKNLQELEMKKSSFQENDNKELEKFRVEQQLTQQKEKLQELIKRDNQEVQTIQQLNQLKKNLIQAERQYEHYQQQLDYAQASQIKYEVNFNLKRKIKELEEQTKQNFLRKYFIDQEDIALTIAKKYDLTVGRILESEQQKLLFLLVILQQRIKGQDRVLRVITEAIFRARAGIQNPSRPLASFLFLGPTGVGKTEVALTIAEQLFDKKKNLLRFDMTEFSEPHSVSKLIGSPPGYIGFEQKSSLEEVREKMNSVLLFDEIEKCHPEVVNLLLQILDNGFLTLANGREINFRNTIIILTSNLGSELYFEGREPRELEEELNLEIKKHFRPEFLNRLDEIVFFNPLSSPVIKEIIRKELNDFIKRVEQEKNIKLNYDEKLIEKIFQEAYSPEYGARPIKHYIEKKIGTLLGRGIIFQTVRVGGDYRLDLEKETDEIKITTISLLKERKNY